MSDNLFNPKTNLSIIPGQTISTVQERRVLLISQLLPAGSAVAGALNENVNSLTKAQVDSLLGQRSLAAGMLRTAQRTLAGITPQPQIDIIGLADDGGATPAAAVITFGGAATEAGTISVSIGSKTDFTFEVPVADLDTPTLIGDALVAAILANGDAPFLGVNALGAVTITAQNGGTTPNTWGTSFEGSVAGVTTALTTAWAGGATDPALTTLFDPIADIRETTIIWPEAFPLATLATEMDARFNVADSVQDGVGISVHSDTPANLKAAVAALNSESVVVFGNSFDSAGGFTNKKGPGIFEIADNIAAEIGIIRALRLTDDASVTQFLNTAGSPGDAFGGIHISSKPYHNTLLPNMSVPAPGEYFTQVEQADLTNNAISVLGANRASNGVVLGPVVTTYLTNTAGSPDTAFKFLNTVDQMSIIREFYVNNLQSRYAQSRLTNGAITTSFALENAQSIRGFCIQLYQLLSAQVVTQSGNAALQAYKDSLTVVVDVGAGKVTINQAPLLVSQLRVIIGAIEVNFG